MEFREFLFQVVDSQDLFGLKLSHILYFMELGPNTAYNLLKSFARSNFNPFLEAILDFCELKNYPKFFSSFFSSFV